MSFELYVKMDSISNLNQQITHLLFDPYSK